MIWKWIRKLERDVAILKRVNGYRTITSMTMKPVNQHQQDNPQFYRNEDHSRLIHVL
ncbi:hypothetical protein CBL_11333 [Carabus blaptoides fortunei]